MSLVAWSAVKTISYCCSLRASDKCQILPSNVTPLPIWGHICMLLRTVTAVAGILLPFAFSRVCPETAPHGVFCWDKIVEWPADSWPVLIPLLLVSKSVSKTTNQFYSAWLYQICTIISNWKLVMLYCRFWITGSHLVWCSVQYLLKRPNMSSLCANILNCSNLKLVLPSSNSDLWRVREVITIFSLYGKHLFTDVLLRDSFWLIVFCVTVNLYEARMWMLHMYLYMYMKCFLWSIALEK